MMKGDHGLDGVVPVWIARISEMRDSLAALEALLDDKERERASRFRFPEDRARFITGRGLLRHGLRRYAPQVPASFEMSYSSLGRPQVSGDHHVPQFSISHTRDVVALAFAEAAQIGIDLEYMQPTVDLLELGERILSVEDFQAFEALPRLEKQLAFYRAWTRKEAYLKARGEGIATGLQAVSVSFTPETISTLTDSRDASASAWRLHAVPLPDEYLGHLACDDETRAVQFFTARIEKDEVRLEPLSK